MQVGGFCAALACHYLGRGFHRRPGELAGLMYECAKGRFHNFQFYVASPSGAEITSARTLLGERTKKNKKTKGRRFRIVAQAVSAGKVF